MFTIAHFNYYYSKYIIRIILAALGDIKSWQYITGRSFPDINSVFRVGPIVTLANTGLYIVVGSLVLLRACRVLNHRYPDTKQTKNRFAEWLTLLKSDTILFSYVGFSILSFIFAVFLGGAFLDPSRMMSWVSLFVLPVIIPSKKSNAILLMVILLALFFLLIWTVYSPWGSPFGSAPNLNIT